MGVPKSLMGRLEAPRRKSGFVYIGNSDWRLLAPITVLWPSGMAAGLTTMTCRVHIPVRTEFFFGLWLMVLPFCTAFGSWIPWGCDLQGTCGPCEGPPTAAWTICARLSPKSPPGQLAAGHRPEGPSWTQQASKPQQNLNRTPREAPRTTLVGVAPYG